MSYKYSSFAAARLVIFVLGLAFQIIVVKSVAPSEYAFLVLLTAFLPLFWPRSDRWLFLRTISRFVPEYLAEKNHNTLLPVYRIRCIS